VLAFSRILNDEEVIVVANPSIDQSQSVDVIVEIELNAVGSARRILYSNDPAPVAPGPVRQTGAVTVLETDGSTGSGPLRVVRVALKPMEVQILGS